VSDPQFKASLAREIIENLREKKTLESDDIRSRAGSGEGAGEIIGVLEATGMASFNGKTVQANQKAFKKLGVEDVREFLGYCLDEQTFKPLSSLLDTLSQDDSGLSSGGQSGDEQDPETLKKYVSEFIDVKEIADRQKTESGEEEKE
jgi:hypothetical protein